MEHILRPILMALMLAIVPALVTYLINSAKTKSKESTTAERYVLKAPNLLSYIGAMLDFLVLGLTIVFTLTSPELPHFMMYVIMALFLCFGTYLILIAERRRVVVDGDTITVYSIIKKAYTFTFDDIISARLQVRYNQANSEWIDIQTRQGKKLTVEHMQCNYERFAEDIAAKAASAELIGFGHWGR